MSNSSDSSSAGAAGAVAPLPVVAPAPGAWARFFDGDIWYSFRTSPVAIVAAVLAFICMFCAVFAPWVSPHNPFDLASLELSDARLPPAWEADGRAKYLLGTDDQGRDILSALMYGARISLFMAWVRTVFMIRAMSASQRSRSFGVHRSAFAAALLIAVLWPRSPRIGRGATGAIA